MKDLRTKLNKLRADASHFALMSSRAEDAEKQELYGRLADELAIEALELEQVLNRTGEHSGAFDREKVVNLKSRSGQH